MGYEKSSTTAEFYVQTKIEILRDGIAKIPIIKIADTI